jgi:general secretion pathway protein A
MMMSKTSVLLLVFATVFLGGELLFPLTALATSDAVETGRLLAVLLDSGGATIGENQLLIDDSNKGDKGFTAHVFEKQLIEQFKDRTKINLADLGNENVPKLAKKLLPALIDAMKQTVDDFQPVINRQGMGFKGFIPATFGTHAAAKFRAKTGVYLKQTKISPRNSSNSPDEFET